MKQRDLNYLGMVDTTLKVLNSNKGVWTASKPCTRQVTAIEAAYTATGVSQQGGDVVTTGITDDKDAAADDAIRKAVLLAGFTKSYAAEKDDHTLFEQMDVSFSLLDKLPDEALAPRLTDLLNRVQAIGEPLAEYGVTPERLDGLETAIGKFTGLNAAPRTAIAGRMTNNQSIPALLRTMRKAFSILDNLLKVFKEDNADFVKTYFNARIILDLGVRHEKEVAAPKK